MSNHNLLLDLAKARQADLAREVAMNRVGHIVRRSQKPESLARKLRLLLASLT
jgi:hypothetical protein